MQLEDSLNDNTSAVPEAKALTSSQIVAAESVQAEEVPTIPLGSLQAVSGLQPEVSVRSVTSSNVLPVPLVAHPSEYHRSLGEWLALWWNGLRPAYLLLSLLPVILGSTLAWTQGISTRTPRGTFHVLRFLVTLAAVLLLQIGAQLINDYYDYLRGIDTSNSFGPGELIQQGLIKPARVLFFGLGALGLGALFGAFVALSSDWLVLVFGLIGLFAAYFYSGTPWALSSHALGELVSFFIFGPLLTLAAYLVQTGHVNSIVFVYSISLGLLATAFIHLNNMRDAESDAQAGKYTLASLLGWRLSRTLYLLLLLGAYIPVVTLALPHHAPHLLLLVLWTLPGLIVVITGVLRTYTPASLHVAMYQTLALETFFTLLLMVALVLMAFIPVLLPHVPSLKLPF